MIAPALKVCFISIGCLHGWTAIIGQPNCYFITDLRPLLKYQLHEYCQSIYGRIAQPHDFYAVMQFMRLILKDFVENRSHSQIEEDIAEIIKNGDDFLARGFPLCERPKSKFLQNPPNVKLHSKLSKTKQLNALEVPPVLQNTLKILSHTFHFT